MLVDRAIKHKRKKEAQLRLCLTECFQRVQTYAARLHLVWVAGMIKIHYREMRWRLIPDDFDKCVKGVNSEKLRQELLDVQIIPLLSRASDKSGVAVGQKGFDNGTWRWLQ